MTPQLTKPKLLPPKLAVSHHFKGLKPALAVMAGLGFKAQDCLAGSGISQATIDLVDDIEIEFHLEQEFHIYRNMLRLSENPLLGLKLGRGFPAESYGLLGYAMLSARTLGEAMALAQEFGTLTFSHFKLGGLIEGEYAGLVFEPAHYIPDDLLALYSDRDIQASFEINNLLDSNTINARRVALIHGQSQFKGQYQQHWGCPVSFGAERNESWYMRDSLDQPMPRFDSETSNICRRQCQTLLQKLSSQGSFSLRVRQRLVAQPGKLPDIESVARDLACSSRTLRRKLQHEGSSFQQLSNEIRRELAQEYLRTGLSVERVAELLGYTEVSNFSHAFKRWRGISPRQFQQNF
ncbi:MAG: AraC family transcriptional regulator [Cellvibrionaceae bacterium]|nr:AraC family transcriptional regulator [Cellvibrionaceae bacterium]